MRQPCWWLVLIMDLWSSPWKANQGLFMLDIPHYIRITRKDEDETNRRRRRKGKVVLF